MQRKSRNRLCRLTYIDGKSVIFMWDPTQDMRSAWERWNCSICCMSIRCRRWCEFIAPVSVAISGWTKLAERAPLTNEHGAVHSTRYDTRMFNARSRSDNGEVWSTARHIVWCLFSSLYPLDLDSSVAHFQTLQQISSWMALHLLTVIKFKRN